MNLYPHRFGQQIAQGRLAKPRRTREQNVVERFAALARRLDTQQQSLANLLLPHKILKGGRPQPIVERNIRLVERFACRHRGKILRSGA